ncbi:hypothetical protein LINPERPRIM_LOCUS13487, partial [Linum perenne]
GFFHTHTLILRSSFYIFTKQKLGQKFEELNWVLESCSGRGIVASLRDLEALIIGDDDDDDNGDSSLGSYMVSKLTKLLERSKEKLWLIGVVQLTTPSSGI